jgi:short-subunit dehydrogenase
MARSLKDMVVVITGASAGIGKALAEGLHARGARLALTARRLDRLQELNRELGGKHLVIAADVAKQQDCQKLVDESLGHFGRIDTLVCNAGYGFYLPVNETTPEQMREIFATNVFGTTDCIAAASPWLLRQDLRDGYRGQVMLVSSFVARRAVPYMGAYSATKAAQLSIAEAMRVELADRGIAVTSVHPIMTKTEFGRTAETLGPVKMPRGKEDTFKQTVEHVVGRMIAAIEKPRPEVWPSRPSRWVAGLATLLPSFADGRMRSYLAAIRRGITTERAP